jgi:hypothetical protein
MSPGWRATFRQSLDQAHAAGMEVGSPALRVGAKPAGPGCYPRTP